MPDDSKIKTIIKCQNIAPLENLYKEIQLNPLKIGVFANNDCCKTFISRLFRLTDKQTKLELNADGTSPTDKLLQIPHQADPPFRSKLTPIPVMLTPLLPQTE